MFHFPVQQGFRVVQRVHNSLTLTLSKCYLSFFSYSGKTCSFSWLLAPKDSVFIHWCNSFYSIFLVSPFIYFRPLKLLCLMHLTHMSAVHADIWCEKNYLGLAFLFSCFCFWAMRNLSRGVGWWIQWGVTAWERGLVLWSWGCSQTCPGQEGSGLHLTWVWKCGLGISPFS